ncbi:hypothetical protein LX64_00355 [Chitinophaga skermanii]|uniref:Uncharacterized protein n=1 Tax=Chitinophaga skermanii TaxID=331697 RepID=A0A327R3X4_9BACT|nr:hypothetical protein [Chitinophaga skermanii]RAJ10748.1 hypothetical protein LX64_00355 [Chitinophaga skermanii]
MKLSTKLLIAVPILLLAALVMHNYLLARQFNQLHSPYNAQPVLFKTINLPNFHHVKVDGMYYTRIGNSTKPSDFDYADYSISRSYTPNCYLTIPEEMAAYTKYTVENDTLFIREEFPETAYDKLDELRTRVDYFKTRMIAMPSIASVTSEHADVTISNYKSAMPLMCINKIHGNIILSHDTLNNVYFKAHENTYVTVENSVRVDSLIPHLSRHTNFDIPLHLVKHIFPVEGDSTTSITINTNATTLKNLIDKL